MSLRSARFELFTALAEKESVFWDVSKSPQKSTIFNFVKSFDCNFNPQKILRRNLLA
jgi:hypothetical protein